MQPSVEATLLCLEDWSAAKDATTDRSTARDARAKSPFGLENSAHGASRSLGLHQGFVHLNGDQGLRKPISIIDRR